MRDVRLAAILAAALGVVILMGAGFALTRVRRHVEPHGAEVVPYGCGVKY